MFGVNIGAFVLDIALLGVNILLFDVDIAMFGVDIVMFVINTILFLKNFFSHHLIIMRFSNNLKYIFEYIIKNLRLFFSNPMIISTI